MTGSDVAGTRKELWNSRIVCATPEVVRNDLDRGVITADMFSLVVFDEVHRTVGDYAYSTIAKMLSGSSGRILGMTATLPSETNKASEIINTLQVTKIAERTEDSPDVLEYTQKTSTRWVRVDLPPELREIQVLLKTALKQRHDSMKAQRPEVAAAAYAVFIVEN